MYRSLSPGAIGVSVGSLAEGLDLAAKHGFEGYHLSIAEAVSLGVDEIASMAAEKGVRLSAFGFPLNFRGDDSEYQQSLADLPALADAAARLGVLRTATWISPGSDELNPADNFSLHVERLAPAAAVLADFGIWLGLEYVSPRTKQAEYRHAFARTMAEMSELCAAVGPNVGFLMDAWHWHNAEESGADLRALRPEQVVDCHVNDAPDLPLAEQLDNVRALPGETGVIDIATFLRALREIGYDGPVMAEPFSDKVRQLSPDEACAVTAAALDKVWGLAGL